MEKKQNDDREEDNQEIILVQEREDNYGYEPGFVEQVNFVIGGYVFDAIYRGCSFMYVIQVSGSWMGLRASEILRVDWKKNEYDSGPGDKQKDGKMHKHKGSLDMMDKK